MVRQCLLELLIVHDPFYLLQDNCLAAEKAVAVTASCDLLPRLSSTKNASLNNPMLANVMVALLESVAGLILTADVFPQRNT